MKNVQLNWLRNVLTIIFLLFNVTAYSCSDDKADIAPEPDPNVETPTDNDNLQLNMATYNLRLITSGDQGNRSWTNRKEYVKKIITKYDFDIFGTQEGLHAQILDLLTLTDYAYTGGGRDDGKEAGEYSAIFYKKDKFELLEFDTFWLSTTPETPSIGWDASLRRICSWGKFKEKETGIEFYFFNTHFDHQGNTARQESAKLILSEIKRIAGSTPAFLTGDFNLQPDTAPVQYLIDSKFIWDSYSSSKTPPKGTIGTYHGYVLDGKTTSRIDYIFVTQTIQVLSYEVINDDIELQAFSSDHFPVMIEAAFK